MAHGTNQSVARTLPGKVRALAPEKCALVLTVHGDRYKKAVEMPCFAMKMIGPGELLLEAMALT
jgi:hypothetical protein